MTATSSAGLAYMWELLYVAASSRLPITMAVSNRALTGPISIGNDGHFSIGKIGTVYSSDTTILTPYWRNRRALEVFGWTPLSDKTFCDRVNAFLDEAQGSITEPAQLLGDFHLLMGLRLYSDTQNVMQWCCDHPDSQLSRGVVKIMKDINPEYILNEFKKIKDPEVAARARQLLGL